MTTPTPWRLNLGHAACFGSHGMRIHEAGHARPRHTAERVKILDHADRCPTAIVEQNVSGVTKR
jgi:hypothetical protein